jgi:hypothetical protein
MVMMHKKAFDSILRVLFTHFPSNLLMERKTTRKFEDRIISKLLIGNFLSTLAPEEFEVLWSLTDPENTIPQIAANNSLSLGQVNTIRSHLAQKAKSLLT